MLARNSQIIDYVWQGQHKTSRNALFSLWSLKAGKNFNQIRSKWRNN